MAMFRIAAIVVLLAGPAYAQDPVPKYGDVQAPKTQTELDRERAADEAYKKSLGNIPNQGPTDPWGGTRATDAPKPATQKTAAKAKPKAAAKTLVPPALPK